MGKVKFFTKAPPSFSCSKNCTLDYLSNLPPKLSRLFRVSPCLFPRMPCVYRRSTRHWDNSSSGIRVPMFSHGVKLLLIIHHRAKRPRVGNVRSFYLSYNTLDNFGVPCLLNRCTLHQSEHQQGSYYQQFHRWMRWLRKLEISIFSAGSKESFACYDGCSWHIALCLHFFSPLLHLLLYACLPIW